MLGWEKTFEHRLKTKWDPIRDPTADKQANHHHRLKVYVRYL